MSTKKIFKRYGIFPGKFKPPHAGHLSCVKNVLNKYELDLMIVIISSKTHEGYTEELSRSMWNIYLKESGLSSKVLILGSNETYSKTPVHSCYELMNILSNNFDNIEYVLLVGEKDGDKRYRSAVKNFNVIVEQIEAQKNGISSTIIREAISQNNKKLFIDCLPDLLLNKEKNRMWEKVKIKKVKKENLEEMSAMGAGAVQSTPGSIDDDKKKEYLEKRIDEVIQKTLSKNKEKFLLIKMINEAILLEKESDKEYSKYYGINILNHEVLIQIKDDIHTKTKSLGNNEAFVEYFKKYVYLYLSDLINTALDVNDIENEISQIRTKLSLSESVKLNVDPSNPKESPIDTELFGDEGEDEPSGKEKQSYLNIPTNELPGSEERSQKRQELELPEGGQEDAKNQAISLMNDIDDIILSGLNKISDELNRELFIRYLAINIMLHIDKAYNEMIEVAPELDVPGYKEETENMAASEEFSL